MKRFHGPKPERGSVVLSLLLMLLAVVSTLGVAQQARPENNRNEQATRLALRQAHDALLGYAAAYPDRVNPEFGPGYLPCPARSERGIAAPACAAHTQSNLGRFPWHTLRTNDLRDNYGNSLWYAVADSYRYNPKQVPLNSNSVGDINVDGDAVVAVVLAPGPPLSGQEHRRQQSRAVKQFLEGYNANNDVTRFTRSGSNAPFNDHLVTLTQSEVMAVAEQRALGELRRRLSAWANQHGGHYPWLSGSWPTTDDLPAAEDGLSAGSLPYHFYNSEDKSVHNNVFDTPLAIDFQLNAADVAGRDPLKLLPADCLQQSPCHVDQQALHLHGPAQCTWWSPAADVPPRSIARCSFTQAFELERGRLVYQLEFALADDDQPRISGPNLQRWRTRHVRSSALGRRANMPGLYLNIVLQLITGNGIQAVAEITVDAHTQGFFAVDAIRYAMDINHDELPAWLVNGGWTQLIYLAWAAPDCVDGGNCLSITRHSGNGVITHRRVRALLIGAGPPLPGRASRTSGAPLSAWFEAGNPPLTGAAASYTQTTALPKFNDRLLMVERLP